MGGLTELIRLGGRRCVGRVHSGVYNDSAASAVTRGAGRGVDHLVAHHLSFLDPCADTKFQGEPL